MDSYPDIDPTPALERARRDSRYAEYLRKEPMAALQSVGIDVPSGSEPRVVTTLDGEMTIELQPATFVNDPLDDRT